MTLFSLGVFPTPARLLAFRILTRVEQTGAFAQRLLASWCGRAGLDAHEIALATELVYGTLRRQLWLDWILSQVAQRPMEGVQRPVRLAMRLGAYQLTSTRIPARAAVDQSVTLLQFCDRGARGFANAVLRRLSVLVTEGTLPKPETGDESTDLSIVHSVAPWVVRALVSQWPIDLARTWLGFQDARPTLCLRANRLRCPPEALRAELQEAGITAESDGPSGITLPGGDVTALAAFKDGRCTVQDPASQLVGEMCAPAAGAWVLDACAAPGGKASHLAELMADQGCVLAVDIHAQKLRLIQDTTQRLGLSCVRAEKVDSTDAAALLALLRHLGRDSVDLALVDAPCTGLGTLRRHPERRTADEAQLTRVTELQRQLLEAVCQTVRPGGALVYSVCSPLEAEGLGQVRSFLQRHPEFVAQQAPVPFEARHDDGVGPFYETWSRAERWDSFFAVRLVRN